ncbi:MAG: hypothetical protein P8P98_00505, partial [Emcibacteraceae bacterium]|nr:hypothetical protein [Emcibacteraceae bacterium]
MPQNNKITIDEIGGRGDGLAKLDGKVIYIPYGAPGDVADVKLNGSKGRIRHIHQNSPHRIEPVCEHFTKCGGCNLQHISEEYYRSFKEGLIKTALENQGVDDIEIADLIISPKGSRRRTTLQAIGRGDGKIVLGYSEKGSHNLIDLNSCPILMPILENLITPIKILLSGLLKQKEKMSVSLTAGDNGVDMVLKGKGEISLDLRMDLAEFADKN